MTLDFNIYIYIYISCIPDQTDPSKIKSKLNSMHYAYPYTIVKFELIYGKSSVFLKISIIF